MASAAKLKISSDAPSTLAQRLCERLLKERIVPRFVDSYVVEHGRYGLQVHAGLYRDLLTLLQREALVAASARALEIVSKGGDAQDDKKLVPMARKDLKVFRQKYVAALTRQKQWNVSDSLDFQSDLQMYEEILLRAGLPKRARKPFEAANHPFVDRCAFVLDSSFLEKARVAASRSLNDIEALATTTAVEILNGASR